MQTRLDFSSENTLINSLAARCAECILFAILSQ